MSQKVNHKAPCWERLCAVDVAALQAWLAAGGPQWPPIKGMQPNRADIPSEAVPVMEAVCRHMGEGLTWLESTACVARIVPGVTYEMHKDGQPVEWVTRVHVPIQTNPESWFAFAEQWPEKAHFDVGWAYSFYTLKDHNYGNFGTTDRVHLMFDVVRGGR